MSGTDAPTLRTLPEHLTPRAFIADQEKFDAHTERLKSDPEYRREFQKQAGKVR